MNTRQTEAARVLSGVKAAGKNVVHEEVITKAVSLTGDPRLYPQNPDSPYSDLGERYGLAIDLLSGLASSRGGEGQLPQKKRSVVVTFKETEEKSEKWEEADDKTKEFRQKVKKAGKVTLKKGDAEYLKNKGLLPEKFQGSEITSAIHLYARGAKSEELARKAETSPMLKEGERDYLLRTSYFLACFEEANLKQGLPTPSLLQTANLNPEVSVQTYDDNVIATPDTFVLWGSGDTFVPIIPSAERGDQPAIDIQSELGDRVFDAIEKGGEKIVKKELKEAEKAGVKAAGKAVGEEVAGVAAKEVAGAAAKQAAGIAAKAGVKAAVMTGAEALGTTVPVVGNIIAWLAVEVGEKVLGWLKNQFVKLGHWVREHDNLVAGIGVAAVLAGLVFGIPFLSILGLATFGMLAMFGSPDTTIAAIGTVTIGMVILGLTALKATVTGLGTAFIYVVALLILIIITFYIITVGGYVVPYWSLNSPGGIPGNQENPYIGVTKVADPTASNTPRSVTYTITINAKQGNLTNVKVTSYDCKVFKKNKSTVSCPPVSLTDLNAKVSGITIDANGSFSFTYTVSYGSAYTDALVVDTITITADSTTKPGVSASGTASVCFGDCPSDCVKVVPGGWPSGTESNLLAAVATLSTTYAPYMQKVCASSFGDVNLCYNPSAVPDGGNCNQVIYARHFHGTDCDVVFNRCGIESQGNALYLLTHELSHHIQSINGSYLSQYVDSGAFGETPYCTYGNTNGNEYEGMAEADGLFVGTPSWNQCISPSYQSKYPKSYQFARDIMFR